jgi:hypothetical protein
VYLACHVLVLNLSHCMILQDSYGSYLITRGFLWGTLDYDHLFMPSDLSISDYSHM